MTACHYLHHAFIDKTINTSFKIEFYRLGDLEKQESKPLVKMSKLSQIFRFIHQSIITLYEDHRGKMGEYERLPIEEFELTATSLGAHIETNGKLILRALSYLTVNSQDDSHCELAMSFP